MTASIQVLGLVLGSLESFLVMVVIAIATGIYNALMKKGEGVEPPKVAPPLLPRPRPRPGMSGPPPGSRLGATETARSEPARTPSPPPIPSIARMLQSLLTEEGPPVIGTPLSHLPERVEVEAEAPVRRTLEFARRREASAEALSQTVAKEMDAIVPTPAVLKRGLLQPVAPVLGNREMAARLRNRSSLRQLVLASVILGPPTALAGEDKQLF